MASSFNEPMGSYTSHVDMRQLSEHLRLQTVTRHFSQVKPLSEFLNVKHMSLPTDWNAAKSRVQLNLAYFASNYVVVAVILAIYDLLTNFILILDLLFVAGSLMLIKKLDGQDLNLGFTSISPARIRLYTGLIGVPLLILASPFTTLIWLVGANGVAILGHAAILEETEELELLLGEENRDEDGDETEQEKV